MHRAVDSWFALPGVGSSSLAENVVGLNLYLANSVGQPIRHRTNRHRARISPSCPRIHLVRHDLVAIVRRMFAGPARGTSMIRFVLSTSAALLLATSVCAQEPPPLRTAVDGTFAPHAFTNLSGGYQGFNVDLANEIGKRLKRKIVLDAAQFSGLVPALQAGTYDFLSAPTTVTKERAESMLFTEGYLNTDFQFLIKKGSPKVTKLEDLKGKTISVNKGSAYDSGRATLRARSAGRSNPSARRPTRCRRFWSDAPTPMSPAIRSSHGRSRTTRSWSCRTCIRLVSSGLRRCARTPASCARRSTSPSNA